MSTSGDDGKPRHQLADLSERDAGFISYLDTLLSEIDTSPVAEDESQTKVNTSDAATHDHRGSFFHEKIAQQSRIIPDTDIDLIDKRQSSNGLPHWAKSPFEVLIFEIADITLSVPLIGLTGILQLSEPVCRLPGQPFWHLGLVRHGSQKIVVVDTTRLIMPERVNPETHGQTIIGHYLLLIGDGELGLLIDKITATLKLEKEDVRWRRESVRQAWFAGVIVGQLSVLLNVDALLEILHKP